MKIFISWSGGESGEYAKIFREWLPATIQAVKPYYSPEDINKGARWASEISKELDESQFGIICLTKDNLNAPWLLFESGALAKSLEKGKVVPVLFGLEPADVAGPLAQFQAVKFEEGEIHRLLRSINIVLAENGLEQSVLDGVFRKWWPDLQAKVEMVSSRSTTIRDEPNVRSDRDILEEILELTRSARSTRSDVDTVVYRKLRGVDPLLLSPIDELELTVRTTNCLKAEGIHYVGELLSKSGFDLLHIPNLGKKGVVEIQNVLAEHDLLLRKPL